MNRPANRRTSAGKQRKGRSSRPQVSRWPPARTKQIKRRMIVWPCCKITNEIGLLKKEKSRCMVRMSGSFQILLITSIRHSLIHARQPALFSSNSRKANYCLPLHMRNSIPSGPKALVVLLVFSAPGLGNTVTSAEIATHLRQGRSKRVIEHDKIAYWGLGLNQGFRCDRCAKMLQR